MESTLVVVVFTVGLRGFTARSVLGVALSIADVLVIFATEVVGFILADIGAVIWATDVAVVLTAAGILLVVVSSSVEDSVRFAAGVEVVNPFFFIFATFFFTAAGLGVRSIVTFRSGLLAVVEISAVWVALAMAVELVVFAAPVIAIDNFFVSIAFIFITNSVVMEVSVRVVVGVTAHFSV